MSKKTEKNTKGQGQTPKSPQRSGTSAQKNGRQQSQNKHPPERKKPSTAQRNAGSGSRKKRMKNQIPISGNTDYGDLYHSQEGINADAENILKKPKRESALHYSSPPPPAKEPYSPRKRRLLRILFYGGIMAIVLTIFLILSFTVFFKIDSISVEGDTRYNEENIVASSMIRIGDNFFLCNTSPGENEIWKKFPYIESVRIEKKLFNKIVINVREAVPTSVIESEGKYVLLSESGKIIDISDKKQEDVPIVMGAKLDDPTLSSSAVYKDKSVEGYVQEILRAAEFYKIGVLKVIDITKLSNISLETKDGLHIIIGSPEKIEHKMMTAAKIMKKDVPKGDVGTLDVSLSAAEGGKSYFSSKKPTEQSAKPETSKPEASKPEVSAPDTSKPEESSSESFAQESEETSYEESSEESSEENSEESYEESSDEESYEENSDEESDDENSDEESYEESSDEESYEESYEESSDEESSDEESEEESSDDESSDVSEEESSSDPSESGTEE